MRTTKKAPKIAVRKESAEIVIGADGSVPPMTHISISKNGGTFWRSADKKLQWEIYFLNDPFDASIITSADTGKTRHLRLRKKVTAGDQFNYHVEGPRRLRKDQIKISSTGGLIIDD